MDDKDLRQTVQFLIGADADDKMIERIKKDIKDHNLTEKIDEIESQYSPLIKEYLRRISKMKDVSPDEKTKIIMELKKQLPQTDQKQFDNVMKMLKIYFTNLLKEK